MGQAKIGRIPVWECITMRHTIVSAPSTKTLAPARNREFAADFSSAYRLHQLAWESVERIEKYFIELRVWNMNHRLQKYYSPYTNSEWLTKNYRWVRDVQELLSGYQTLETTDEKTICNEHFSMSESKLYFDKWNIIFSPRRIVWEESHRIWSTRTILNRFIIERWTSRNTLKSILKWIDSIVLLSTGKLNFIRGSFPSREPYQTVFSP